MKNRRSHYDIVQIQATYIPKDITFDRNFFEDVPLWLEQEFSEPGVRFEDLSFEGLLVVDLEDLMYNAIIVFDVTGYSGLSNDATACSGTEFEFRELGIPNYLDPYKEELTEIALRYFKEHPRLQKKHGLMFSINVGKPKSLDECKNLLTVSFPTVWKYWSSYDEYTHEMDVELVLEGELDVTRLTECLVKDSNDENS